MSRLVVIIFFIPFMVLSQNELIIKGKMNYGDTKTARVQIIDLDNPSDTILVKISKKKFELDPLDSGTTYELIFTCGDRTKSIKIEGQSENEEKQKSFYLEIDWREE
jgi:hypothetical protein